MKQRKETNVMQALTDTGIEEEYLGQLADLEAQEICDPIRDD